MTGNDIVDIAVAAAESNWRRKGYLEKIFSLREQRYINNSLAPDEMVWKLWTMKESAYKIYSRQYGGRFFAPQKFTCTIITDKTGIVGYRDQQYQTTTISTKKYIYSISRSEGITNAELINPCFHLPEMKYSKQQQFIYNKIVDCYVSVTGVEKESVGVVKDKNGLPFLKCADNVQIPISISHHGHFAAFTIN